MAFDAQVQRDITHKLVNIYLHTCELIHRISSHLQSILIIVVKSGGHASFAGASNIGGLVTRGCSFAGTKPERDFKHNGTRIE